MREHEIDNLLLFGGDGSLQHVLPLLESWNVPCIALADHDRQRCGRERNYTLGHDSACNFAIQAVEGIQDDGRERCPGASSCWRR